MKLCKMTGCEKMAFARGWCRMHYMRWWSHGDPNVVLKNMPLHGEIERFIKKMAAWTSDDCLLWPFSKNNMGYGQININGKKILVHRIACRLRNGIAPSKRHEAAHSCRSGKSGCVNPRHVRWATRKENAADMLHHGTVMHGETHPTAKLKNRQALMIFKRAKSGEKYEKIAKDFNISASMVGMIKRQKRW